MASGRRGQSEISLGAGHVAGMFIAVLVLCGVFFTLGYVMGRGNSQRNAAGPGGGSSTIGAGGNLANPNGTPASNSWDFYPHHSSSPGRSSASGNATPATPATPAPPAQPQPSGPIAMSPKPAGVRVDRKPPSLAGGRQGVMLQVAAMRNRGDARSLAGFLKQKGYPAFVWGPGSDRLYRVQVGPYPDSKAAHAARTRLEKEGFQSILKK